MLVCAVAAPFAAHADDSNLTVDVAPTCAIAVQDAHLGTIKPDGGDQFVAADPIGVKCAGLIAVPKNFNVALTGDQAFKKVAHTDIPFTIKYQSTLAAAPLVILAAADTVPTPIAVGFASGTCPALYDTDWHSTAYTSTLTSLNVTATKQTTWILSCIDVTSASALAAQASEAPGTLGYGNMDGAYKAVLTATLTLP